MDPGLCCNSRWGVVGEKGTQSDNRRLVATHLAIRENGIFATPPPTIRHQSKVRFVDFVFEG